MDISIEPLDTSPPVPSDNIPDPTPPTNTFGSSGTFGLPVPMLPNIDSAPSTPGSSVTVSQATSSLVPTQQLFGKSSAPPLNISTTTTTTTTSTETLVLPEESVVEGAAGQSSLVSGSVDQHNALDSDLVANDGESRDSTTVGGVSSSDGRREWTANDFESSEAKRQRESPNEAVTSSETRQQANRLEQEVSDEDPNESALQEQQDNVIDLENDEEVIEDEMEGNADDDEDSLGNDEEEFEEDRDPAEHEVVDLSSDDDAPEDDIENDAESLNDVEEDDDVDDIIIEDNNEDIEEVLGGEVVLKITKLAQFVSSGPPPLNLSLKRSDTFDIPAVAREERADPFDDYPVHNLPRLASYVAISQSSTYPSIFQSESLLTYSGPIETNDQHSSRPDSTEMRTHVKPPTPKTGKKCICSIL